MGSLKEFFAVTRSKSLYRVFYDEETDRATVEKIANWGDSPFEVGARLPIGSLDYAASEDYVGIVSSGIFLYYGHQRQGKEKPLPGSVSTCYWGPQTSGIVALFLESDKARTCVQSAELKIKDERWRNETRKVLKAIGNDHPRFVISVSETP